MEVCDDRRPTTDSHAPSVLRRLWSVVGRPVSMGGWLIDGTGDMVWSAIVIITVMLPLASLTIDIPRYFRLSGQLSQALEATGQGVVNTCLDMGHFERSGQVRMVDVCIYFESTALFTLNTQELTRRGYQPRMTDIRYDPTAQRLYLAGEGALSAFFGITPALTLRRSVESRVRMVSQ